MTDNDARPTCPDCGGGEFEHKHETAYGIEGTHMAGTEYYKCKGCKRRYFASDKNRARGFNFWLD